MSDWSATDPQPHGPRPVGVAPSHLVAEPAVADPATIDGLRYPQPTIGGGSGPGAYMAMPRLMGAPAYSRPPRPVAAATPQPFDPDDLPIEAWRSDEEQQLAEAAALAWEQQRAPGERGLVIQPSGGSGLRGIAARLLRAGS